MGQCIPSGERHVRTQFKVGSAVASAVAGGIGLLALCGWVFDIPLARSLLPGGPSMSFNSSVGFTLASVAALLLLWPRGRWWREAAFYGCAGAILVLGALTLSQYVFGWNLGIDLLLHPRGAWDEPSSYPGRMAPTTSMKLILLGAALCLLGGRRAAWVGQSLAAVVGLLGLVTILGTIYGIQDLQSFPPTAAVSAGTAVASFLLGIALLMATPDRGPMAIVSSRTLTGSMARRILPLVIVVPSMLGFTRVIGESVGLYGIGVGSALLVAGNVVLFTALVLYVLGSLRVVEQEGIRAQEALRRSEEQLRAVLEALPVAVFITDARGRIETANPAAESLWGSMPPPSLGPERYGEFYRACRPGTDRRVEPHEWGLARALVSGAAVTAEEMDIEALDGRRRTILNYALPIRDGMGAIVGGVAVNIDITARKQMEIALRQSEERYRTFIENSSEGIWRFEFDEPLSPDLPEEEQVRYTYEHAYFAECNVALARQYGYESPEEIVGRPLKEFLIPDNPRNREFLLAFIRSGYRLTEAETHERTADGEERIFMNNLIGVRDDRGRLLRAWGSQRDITDRKLAQRFLIREQEFLRQVIDATPSMVFVKDWNGRFVLANEALAKVYGVRVEDLIGRTDADFSSHPDEVAAFLRDDREVMLTRRQKLIPEEPVTDAEGRRRWFSTIKVPLVEADGTCSRVLGVATDITDRKRAEEILRSSNERLEEAIRNRTRELEESYVKLRHSERMAFVGTLSAGIGHDIGNLLLPIRERLESLAHDDSLPETTRADLATTRTGLNYLTRLTSALRILAADPEEDHGPADVTDVAAWWHEAEPLLHSVLPRNVTLQWSPPPRGLAVRIGAAALTQVVFNLVQNAGDALADFPDGRVHVSAEPVDEAWARFVVADNGPGMTDVVRERCMDPFFTTKTRRVSTGMGLTLVHGLVTKAGGRIDLESAPGQGTTFRITLPAAATIPAGGGPARPLAVVSVGDRRTAGFVCALLGSMGFDVAEQSAPDGAAADLWVVAAGVGGPSEPDVARVLEFVRVEPGRRALIIGGDSPGAEGSERVLHVPGRLDPLAIRRALQKIAGQLAPAKPEVVHGPVADQRAVR